MSDERDIAEVVRSAYLAVNNDDEDAFLDTLADDVEWHSPTIGILPANTWIGRDAVRRGRQEIEGDGRHVHTTLQEIRTSGDAALVFGVVTAESAQRGRVMLPMAWIWRVREGRAVRIESFPSRQAALAAWAKVAPAD